MGKRMKHKHLNPRRLPQRSAADNPTWVVSKSVDPDGDEGSRARNPCVHFNREIIGSNRAFLGIRSSQGVTMACQDCRGEPSKRSSKEKGDPANSKTPETCPGSNSIWVCLDCSRSFCGGVAASSEPHGHARRHAKSEHHPVAVESGNPLVCWCFACNSLVPIEPPEGAMDVENNVEEDQLAENGGEHLVSVIKRGYLVRGLLNLGNTCFFNSVMQNLLAISTLRDCLVNLDVPLGPITMELKKLFVETSVMDDLRGVINPGALFMCICSKAPQFGGFQQQDSHELLRCLLDGLHVEETNARNSLGSSDEQDKLASSSTASFIDVLFGGQLSSAVSCVECGHVSLVYEAFLDLSLPVPSKKPLPRKVPSTTTKKNKVPPGEGNRRRSPRQKGAAKRSRGNEPQKAESFSSQSDCDETFALGVEKNFTVADHVESAMILDGADSVYQKCEVTIAQCSESGQICQSESNVQCTMDSPIRAQSKEIVASSYSCRESSCKDEADSSCVQDSGVLLFPYKEVGSNVVKTNETPMDSQKLENVDNTADLVKESSLRTVSVAGCEPVEAEFCGFGDSLNEPEITSDLKTGTGVVEELETALWVDNSTGTNHNEADDTSSPISVESCLALFTKPEVLSDDHAWHCEICSEISANESAGCRKIARLDESETLKSQLDGCEVKTRWDSPSLELDCVDTTVFELVGRRKMTTTTSKNLESHADILDDANTDVNASTEPPGLVGGSHYNTCIYGQAECDKSLESSGHIIGGQDHCAVVQKDEEFTDSDSSSQYLSCPSSHEKQLPQENSGHQDSDSCSVNEANFGGLGYDGQAFAAAFHSSPGQTETVMQSSCENDNFSEVDQVANKGFQEEKKGSLLLGEVRLADNSGGMKREPKNRKVKREATKRILINKAPPILTIHLKRFSQDAYGRLNKLSGHVSFQEILDLRPYIDPRSRAEKTSYRLIGVVEHLGSMTRGHYVAYLRGEKHSSKTEKGSGPTWFYANDSHVREASLSEVLQREAYILFYERA